MPETLIPEGLSFGMILDLLIVIAVVGLWLAWWRNLNRLKSTERLLAESIQELEQASSQLKLAMEHIRASEQEKVEKERREKMRAKRAAEAAAQQASALKDTTTASAASPADDTVLVRTLLLQREGKSEEEIADTLKVPIDQVRLMLKMHSEVVS